MSDLHQQNIKLIIEYDGTKYAGWQLQEKQPSIQGCLLFAIEQMTGMTANIQVAGRTDAGVHARAQVANFITTSCISAHRFAPGLNAYLPNDISVHCSMAMPFDFSARLNSISKVYCYRIYVGPQRAAFESKYAWQLRNALDVEAIREAADKLVGEKDFNAFRSVYCDAPHAIRHMFNIRVRTCPRPPLGEIVEIEFHANAYCRHMCRILTGTLVEIGQHKRAAESIVDIMESGDRKRAGVTAPAHGLCLEVVYYSHIRDA